VSYSGMEIRNEDLQAILGAIAQETLRSLADGLLARDSAGLLKQIDTLLEQGQDLRQLTAGVVEHIRNLIVSLIAKEPGKIIELPAADLDELKQQAIGTDAERLIMLFDSLSRTLDEMRWSPHQRFTLEVGLVKACSLAPLRPLGEVLERMRTLEARLGTSSQGYGSRSEAVRERTTSYAASHPVPAAGARSGPSTGHGDPWGKILGALKQRKPNLGSALQNSRVVESTDEALIIGIKGSSFQVELADKKESRDMIEQLAAEVLGKRVQITFRLLATETKLEPKSTAPKKTSPGEQDPFVQDALSIFNGKIVEPEGQE
jgi:DNA polymerase III subunit gamma/tau